MTDYTPSRTVRIVFAILGACILLLVSFATGLSVGENKGRHFFGLCGGFDQAMRPPHGFRGPFPPPALPGGYGVFGQILSVSGTTMVVHGKDNADQTVLVTSSTIVRVGQENGTWEDVRTDRNVSVFGMPNGQGHIVARLIRLVD